jgi:GNAT superfamily N-acetyltransferase
LNCRPRVRAVFQGRQYNCRPNEYVAVPVAGGLAPCGLDCHDWTGNRHSHPGPLMMESADPGRESPHPGGASSGFGTTSPDDARARPPSSDPSGPLPTDYKSVLPAATDYRSVLRLPNGCNFRYEVRPDDLQHVRRIVASTGFFNPAEVEVAAELAHERLSRGEASAYHFVFVEHGRDVLGYACYGPIAGTAASFDLYWIAVDRSAHRRGLGRLLLARAEELIRQAGGQRVYVETSRRAQYAPTRRFYERAGYSLEAVLKDFYAPGDDKAIYVKVLTADLPAV